MTPKARVLPVRILKVWFDLVLVLGAVALLLFLIYLVSSLFWAASDPLLDAVVHVAVGERSWKPVLPLTLESLPAAEGVLGETAHLVDARGELRLQTRSRWLHLFTLGEIGLASAAILFIVYLLRRVLINVLADRPFAAANGRHLQWSGYLLLVLAAIVPAVDYALACYALSQLTITSLELRPGITLNKDVFALGLLFLVFGFILQRAHEVYRQEQQLEEEQALTI